MPMHLFTDHDIGGLNRNFFVPDPISRFQYEKVHEAKQGLAEQQAERDLMLAVLEDAIACFQGYFFKPSRSNQKLFLEAKKWLSSNDDDCFSFNNICATWDLDPDALRAGLRRWQVEKVHTKTHGRENILFPIGGNVLQEKRPSDKNV